MVTAGMTVGRAVLFMVDEAIAVIAAVLFNDDGIDAVTKPEVLGDPDILALASTVRVSVVNTGVAVVVKVVTMVDGTTRQLQALLKRRDG